MDSTSRLERLAHLENERWTAGAQRIAAQNAADQVSVDGTPDVDRTGGYIPLGGGSTRGAGTRSRMFVFRHAFAVGDVLFVRFAWGPDEPTDQQYLLAVPFSDAENVDLDGGSVEVYERVMFDVVDDPGWKSRAVRLSETLSVVRGGGSARQT